LHCAISRRAWSLHPGGARFPWTAGKPPILYLLMEVVGRSILFGSNKPDRPLPVSWWGLVSLGNGVKSLR
jgi:hypothetical protein